MHPIVLGFIMMITSQQCDTAAKIELFYDSKVLCLTSSVECELHLTRCHSFFSQIHPLSFKSIRCSRTTYFFALLNRSHEDSTREACPLFFLPTISKKTIQEIEAEEGRIEESMD